jgi:hypothetical protein
MSVDTEENGGKSGKMPTLMTPAALISASSSALAAPQKAASVAVAARARARKREVKIVDIPCREVCFD